MALAIAVHPICLMDKLQQKRGPGCSARGRRHGSPQRGPHGSWRQRRCVHPAPSPQQSGL
eukprot:12883510-Prorocentrum_lima.AAC.1